MIFNWVLKFSKNVHLRVKGRDTKKNLKLIFEEKKGKKLRWPLSTKSITLFADSHTGCPRRLVHIYVAIRYIKMKNTSWTFSTNGTFFLHIMRLYKSGHASLNKVG